MNLCHLFVPCFPVGTAEPTQEIVLTTKELSLVGSFWELLGEVLMYVEGVCRRVWQHKGNEVIHAELRLHEHLIQSEGNPISPLQRETSNSEHCSPSNTAPPSPDGTHPNSSPRGSPRLSSAWAVLKLPVFHGSWAVCTSFGKKKGGSLLFSEGIFQYLGSLALLHRMLSYVMVHQYF